MSAAAAAAALRAAEPFACGRVKLMCTSLAARLLAHCESINIAHASADYRCAHLAAATGATAAA